MRGGALPAALLCLALGLMLAFAPHRVRLPALALLGLGAVAAATTPLPRDWVEVSFLGCWATVILSALLVHLPRGVPAWLAVPVALAAGLSAGAVIAQEGTWLDLCLAFPCAIAVVPAIWLRDRGWGVAIKVVGSWLIAVALLAALLPTVSTPGYAADHMQ